MAEVWHQGLVISSHVPQAYHARMQVDPRSPQQLVGSGPEPQTQQPVLSGSPRPMSWLCNQISCSEPHTQKGTCTWGLVFCGHSLEIHFVLKFVSFKPLRFDGTMEPLLMLGPCAHVQLCLPLPLHLPVMPYHALCPMGSWVQA